MELVGFLPDFGNLALTLIAFVAALSVIVAVHEYGHYIVGRWSGIHAEVFSLGFGPSLWSRVDRRGTRWQIAALPFGGYVKFLGDANAASGKDGDAMATLPERDLRRTMHGAPLWARAATVAAGPMFNFILSILIFAGYFWVSGIATDQPVVGVVKPAPGAEVLQPGDRITALGDTATPDLESFLRAARDLPAGPTARYTIDRGGQQIDLTGPYPYPPYVDSVQPLSAAADAGVREGDFVQAINGQPVQSFDDMRAIVGNSNGAPVTLQLIRDGAALELTMSPRRVDLPKPEGGFETRWLVGLGGGLVFTPELRSPGVIEGLGLAVQQLINVVSTSLSGLWHMITGAISTCNLQGPLGIAETSGAAASMGAGSFILFIATLSTAVGMMNLFPVPVLDGGHLVFHAYEAVTGRPPSDRALRGLMTVGLTLLLSMMLFALTNDLFCP